jgi:hypothetical protein
VANHYQANHYAASHYAAFHYRPAVVPAGPQGFGGGGASALTGVHRRRPHQAPELVHADAEWIDLFAPVEPAPEPKPQPRLRKRRRQAKPPPDARPITVTTTVAAAVGQWAKTYLAWEMVASWRGDAADTAPKPPGPTVERPWTADELEEGAAVLEQINLKSPREIFEAHIRTWRAMAKRLRFQPAVNMLREASGEIAVAAGMWYARRWLLRSAEKLVSRFWG